MICAVGVNDEGDILAYTCQSTKHACEEWCEENLPWKRMKELGASIKQAEITLLED